MRPVTCKVAMLNNAQPPQNVNEMRSFLGNARYSSPFIPRLLVKTAKLRGLLVDKGQTYTWTAEHQSALTKKFWPVAYFNKASVEVEKRYSQIELECLAVTWAVEKNKHYLIGSSFHLITKYQPPVSLLNNSLNSAPLHIERMRVKSMEFQFVAKHRPGKNNPENRGSWHPEMATLGDDNEVEDYVDMVIGKLFKQ